MFLSWPQLIIVLYITGIIDNSGHEPVAFGTRETMLSTGPMCKHAEDIRPCFKVLTQDNASMLEVDKKVSSISYETVITMQHPCFRYLIFSQYLEKQKNVLSVVVSKTII